MRGTTLNALIQKLRLELKIAESPALGKNTRGSHANALRSAQERLYSDWDWPFKNIYRDVTLAAGQRSGAVEVLPHLVHDRLRHEVRVYVDDPGQPQPLPEFAYVFGLVPAHARDGHLSILPSAGSSRCPSSATTPKPANDAHRMR